MVEVLFHSLTGGFKIPILFVSFILMNLDGCKSTQLFKIQGQEANLVFPYPCDSTEVTLLHHLSTAPFYRSTDGSSLALPDDQVNRFQVQNRIENGNCSLDLTISNLIKRDAGKYISLVYKDGQQIVGLTTRVELKIDYPSGKASCVVDREKGGDWVSVDCEANVRGLSGKVGGLSGEIECFQDGVWMPSLTDPIETDSLLKQTILIRKSQPVFCCFSTWDEKKERCDCKDTGLFITDDDSNDPCPPLEITTMPLLTTLTENNQSDYHSTMTSSIPINMETCNFDSIQFIISITIESIVLILVFVMVYKMIKRVRNSELIKYTPLTLCCWPISSNNKKDLNDTVFSLSQV